MHQTFLMSGSKIGLRLLGLFSVVTLGIVSILGSGGGSEGGLPTPTPPPPVVNTNYVVYMADADTDGTNELYQYSLQTNLVTRVNGNLIAGGNVTSFAISPDRQWIAYVADENTDEVFELYVTQASLTSNPVKVSGTMVSGGDVSDHPVWAPNSSRIAYRNNGSSATRFDLSTVTPVGHDRIIVSASGAGPGNVVSDSYSWSPDSSLVAYRSDQESTAIELWTNSASQQINNNKVNGNLVMNGNVTEYSWAPNGSRIAYRADQTVDETFDLYTSLPDGSSNISIGGVTGTGHASNVEVDSIVWAPNSSRLAYRADIITDDDFDLYTNLPGGGTPIKVSGGIVAGRDVIGTPSWAPDSSRLAYLADINVNDVFELFTSLPLVANTSLTVNGTLAGGNVATGPSQDTPAAWAPDSSLILYVAEQDSAGVPEIYAGQPDASGSFKVSGSMGHSNGEASLGVKGEVWAPDGQRFQYQSDQLVDNTFELWTSTGFANPRITNTPAVAAGLESFGKWAPDSSYIVYASQEDTAGVIELYMSAVDGSSKQKISANLVNGGNVDPDTFAWAP